MAKKVVRSKADRDNTEKIKWREALQIHYRAFREMNGRCPGVFAATALHSAVSALSP